MKSDLSIVLITGALTGIGRATALAFAHHGATVVVSGRRDDTGQALATEFAVWAFRLSNFAPTCGSRPTSTASSSRA